MRVGYHFATVDNVVQFVFSGYTIAEGIDDEGGVVW